MSTIKLADDTTFEGEIGYTGREIRIKVNGDVARERFFDFMDKSKMATITYTHGAYYDIFHLFDNLQFVEPRSDGLFNVWIGPSEGAYIENDLTNVPDVYLPK